MKISDPEIIFRIVYFKKRGVIKNIFEIGKFKRYFEIQN